MTKRSYGPYSFESSNQDKVLFPDSGISKGELIEYYERVSEWMLPHLEGRPVVLHRFPDGIEDDGFYQKQAGAYFPAWIETVRVALRTRPGTQDLVVCRNQATLAYLANQACITLHRWLCRTDELERPDLLVIDLDPPQDGDFEDVRWAAMRGRDLFEELDLPCYVALTGSRGLHLTVPLDRSADFDEVRELARGVAGALAARYPDELTTEQRKAERRGRIYLDVARNAFGQTAVAPWSVRALPGAPVSAPVEWIEIEDSRLGPRDVTLRSAVERLERRGDPWSGMRRRARSLGAARRALERLG